MIRLHIRELRTQIFWSRSISRSVSKWFVERCGNRILEIPLKVRGRGRRPNITLCLPAKEIHIIRITNKFILGFTNCKKQYYCIILLFASISISLSLYIYIYIHIYLSLSLSMCIYIYIYIHMYTYIYIYIYILQACGRGRLGARAAWGAGRVRGHALDVWPLGGQISKALGSFIPQGLGCLTPQGLGCLSPLWISNYDHTLVASESNLLSVQL